VDDPARGLAQVEVLADDDGRLASQFERHRRQVGAGASHHVAPHGGRAREQQVIEGQGSEAFRHLDAAVDDAQFGRVEALRHDTGKQCTQSGRELGHLHDDAVARRERGNHRSHRQRQRVVPRHDDADHSLRLVTDPGPSRQAPPGDAAPRRSHPPAQPRARVANALDADELLEEQGLLRRAMAEVARDGFRDLCLVPAKRPLEAFESITARRQRRVRLGHEGRPLQFEGPLQRLYVRGGDQGANAFRGHAIFL